ncbi:MAG: hypothetical protein IJ571_10735 [Ruminococcus sp.]|nr:hypothetical protein [Ruminococcus sp.]
MKYIFLPFINSNAGNAWRQELEDSFISGEGSDLTAEINNIRRGKQDYINLSDYYHDLHEKKAQRQKLWLERLALQTAAVFDDMLRRLSEDERDPKKTTIIAALPEFFWVDINDNHKHEDDIINYHKPVYSANLINCLLNKSNPLMSLTNRYHNLIFFAGTVMWKYIDGLDNKDEKIYNTLMIFGSGEIQELWSKANISTIDGFCDWSKSKVVKDKTGHGSTNTAPVVTFNEKTFVYDICLDFIQGKDKMPLSSELYESEADANVLICAGMSVDSNKVKDMRSNILFRCDGNGSDGTFAEITDRSGTQLAKQTNDVIIDRLETTV